MNIFKKIRRTQVTGKLLYKHSSTLFSCRILKRSTSKLNYDNYAMSYIKICKYKTINRNIIVLSTYEEKYLI